MIANSKVFHVGSLSLTDEPSAHGGRLLPSRARATLAARCPMTPTTARTCGLLPSLPPSTCACIVPDMDLVKISDEECELMTGHADPVEASAALLARGPKVVAVTLGGSGALVRCADGVREVPGFPAEGGGHHGCG